MFEGAHDWQAKAKARVAAMLQDGQCMALWETLRNPDNKVSRQAVRDIEPGAPSPSATVKAWQDWLTVRFPEFAGLRAEKSARLEAEAKGSAARWKRGQDEAAATSGPSFQRGSVIYPNALEYVRVMLADGYKPVKSGIGVVILRNEARGVETKPWRNAHINAALRLLEGAGNE